MSSSRSNNQYDFLMKLLVIGDSGVGKSCLLLRFAEDCFTPNFITTIGIDFKIKTVEMDGKRIRLQIWDTAGQERFRTITTAYYKGAMGILLVYDVTDEQSFQHVGMWMKNIQTHAQENVNTLLVGNKCDMTSDKVVETAQGQALAKEYSVKFYEASAKTNQNVNECFMALAADVKARLMDGKSDKTDDKDGGRGISLKSGDDKPKDSGGCCGGDKDDKK